MTSNVDESLRLEFAKHPCEICGSPAVGFVWDIEQRWNRDRTMYIRKTIGDSHWFCDEHYRESRILDTYEPIILPWEE